MTAAARGVPDPVRIEGRRVAVWGLGEEGWSAVEHLRRRLPEQELWVLVDDAPPPAEAHRRLRRLGGVHLLTGAAALAELPRFEVVVRSPGITLYRPEVEAARSAGVVFTSATQLWFDRNPGARVVCVTGTKGKSTTVSMLAHCLRAAGVRCETAGNIGRSALGVAPAGDPPEIWVLELSSYQTADLAVRPTAAVLLNLFPEHLNWHGSEERYYRDKLRLFRYLAPGAAIVNYDDARIVRYRDRFAEPAYFHHRAGFHLRDGWICEGPRRWLQASELSLAGAHNRGNALAVLAAARRLGASIERCVEALPGFAGLPHRLEPVGEREGVLFVDDSISTIPQSAMAAVESFPDDRALTLLLGGHDRGLDYRELAELVVRRRLNAVVTLPESGARIAAAVRAARGRRSRPRLVEATDLERAVAAARELTPEGGVVLLSPAAASYGAFRDYRERGLAFRAAAGLAAE